MNIKDLNNPQVINTPKLNIKDLKGVSIAPTATEEADRKSASQHWAMFANKTGQESVVSGGLKTASNLPGSALNLAWNFIKLGGQAALYDNPISQIFGIGKEKSVSRNLGKVLGGKVANVADYVDKKTGGKGNANFMEEEKKANELFNTGMREMFGPLEGYKQLGEELIKGKIKQGMPGHEAAQEVLNALQRRGVNDPFGAGFDLLAMGEGVVGAVGKTDLASRFISKTGKTVTAPIKDTGAILGRGAELAKEKLVSKLTPMEGGTVKALEESGGFISEGITKFDEYLNQAKKSVSNFKESTALDLAGEKAEDALTVLQEIIRGASKEKKLIAESLTDTPVGKIVNETLYNLRLNVSERLGAGITSSGELVEIPGRSLIISDTADLTTMETVFKKLTEVADNPTFRKVDDTIDYVQGLLYKRKSVGAIPMNKKMEGLLKQTVGELNGKLKKIGGIDYEVLNTTISEVMNRYEKLNKALGTDFSKGASLMKRVFSPAGSDTRTLFNDIRAITGIDLVDEATLAKLAMEIVGDTRQANLLEQLGLIIKPSKGSAVMEAGKWIFKKLQNQESKARSIIEKATGGKKKLNLKTPEVLKSKKQPGLSIKDVSKTSLTDDIAKAKGKMSFDKVISEMNTGGKVETKGFTILKEKPDAPWDEGVITFNKKNGKNFARIDIMKDSKLKENPYHNKYTVFFDVMSVREKSKGFNNLKSALNRINTIANKKNLTGKIELNVADIMSGNIKKPEKINWLEIEEIPIKTK